MVKQFRFAVYEHYKAHGRMFTWREHITPYRVVVSEVMLQQTHTDRVAQKFDSFIEQFPTFHALAAAPFDQLLRLWKGLGYNRRAQALQKIARLVVDQHAGQLPDDPRALQSFPGLGSATAASVVAFVYNQPTVFIETNIRTVFIYTFFSDYTGIKDIDVLPLVQQTLDRDDPRQWYYALMDYGAMLKKTVGNVSRLSAHYTKQSRFEGSDRQIRGMILQVLLDLPGLDDQALVAAVAKAMAPKATIAKEPLRVTRILQNLCQEKFVYCRHGGWWVAR
jgi:A/G-specific adenine glycosylase